MKKKSVILAKARMGHPRESGDRVLDQRFRGRRFASIFAFAGMTALMLAAPAFADVKTFSGGGDGTTWHDTSNWFSLGVPAQTDAVTVDKASASLSIEKDFAAQSITIGGKTTSTLSAVSFVYGTVVPTGTGVTTPAILLRKNGTLVMHGSGVVKLKGPFKNTEQTLQSEPSVQVLLQ